MTSVIWQLGHKKNKDMDSFSAAQDYLECLPKMAQSLQESNSRMMDVYCNSNKDLFYPMGSQSSARRPPCCSAMIDASTSVYRESSQDVFVATDVRQRKIRAVSYNDEDMDDIYPTDERTEPVMCMSFQQMAEKATSWFLGEECAAPRIDHIIPDDDLPDFDQEDRGEEDVVVLRRSLAFSEDATDKNTKQKHMFPLFSPSLTYDEDESDYMKYRSILQDEDDDELSLDGTFGNVTALFYENCLSTSSEILIPNPTNSFATKSKC